MMGCTQQPLVPMTILLVLFCAFVHVADVVSLGIFVSTVGHHRLFSVVAGVHLMAEVSGSPLVQQLCRCL